MLECVSRCAIKHILWVLLQKQWWATKRCGVQMRPNGIAAVRPVHTWAVSVPCVDDPFQPSLSVEVVGFPQAEHHVVARGGALGSGNVTADVPPAVILLRKHHGVHSREQQRCAGFERAPLANDQRVVFDAWGILLIRR